MDNLFKKYDVPAPRYTSFPTVPYWNKTPSEAQWLQSITHTLSEDDACWSMYIHIPYCERLCTFCGCNTVITRNHEREAPYVDMLLQELRLYASKVPELKNKTLSQVHLGGGTPTFLSAPQLQRLIEGIHEILDIKTPQYEGSLEVDPRVTTADQLEVLYKLGFTRVSLGVQDFNLEVQDLINRFQTPEQVQNVVDDARKIGYQSVNFDLIYGLPKQTEESVKQMIQKTIEVRPDRIAFYSFALVPWIKPQQRRFTDDDLPMGEDKRRLYEIGRELLEEAGYVEIGMDHFALKQDTLYDALSKGQLNRNFMGYTEVNSSALLGLGVSAISETKDCYHQNEKTLPLYEKSINEGNIPTLRGHLLDDMDLLQKRVISSLMTKLNSSIPTSEYPEAVDELGEFLSDELVEYQEGHLKVLEKGRPFLRNICMVFDIYLKKQKPDRPLFSKSM